MPTLRHFDSRFGNFDGAFRQIPKALTEQQSYFARAWLLEAGAALQKFAHAWPFFGHGAAQ
jgi:hypothetical protein